MSSRIKTIRSRFQLIIILALTSCALTAFAVSRDVLSFFGYEGLNNQVIHAAPEKNAEINSHEADVKDSSALVTMNGKIAYGRRNGISETIRIYAIDANPSPTETPLTGTGTKDTAPAYSADGTKIVFVSSRDTSQPTLFVMNSDGSSQRRLANAQCQMSSPASPAFSPDAAKIVFVCPTAVKGRSSEKPSVETPQSLTLPGEIFVMNADGSNVTQLTSMNNDNSPSFSPDGLKIIFERDGDIYTMNPDGSSQTSLLNETFNLRKPSYSPNGMKLVFYGTLNHLHPNGGGAPTDDIFTTNADGTNREVVSSTAEDTDDTEPVWSPDGAKIAFMSYRTAGDGNIKYGIYVVDENGSNEMRLIEGTSSTSFESPTWQAVCSGSPTCPPVVPISLRIGEAHPVAAGRSVEGTITLASGTTPVGGAIVNLSVVGESGILTIPATVTVPENSSQANFTINTPIRNDWKNADILAEFDGNQALATVTVAPAAPDLVASNFNAPATVNIFEDFTATWTVTNSGQVATPNSWHDRVYISPDAEMFNGNDTEVGDYFHFAALGVNESINATYPYTNIPSAAIPATGDYFLIVVTNANQQFNEGGAYPAGNVLVRPIHVTRFLPDIITETINVPAEIEPGVLFNISWTVKNIGNRTTPNGFTSFVRLSFNSTIGDDDDIFLTSVNTNVLIGVDETHTETISYTIPGLPVRPSSDSLVYVDIDPYDEMYEGEDNEPAEMNNRTTQAVRFEYRVPDLQVQSVTPPAEAETDTPFSLNWTIRNAGTRSAGNFTDKVYFSTDNQIGDDVEIGSFVLATNVEPKQSVNRVQNVSVPANAITANGDYYVYVKTDATTQIDEGESEDNNITFQSLHVIYSLPDLRVESVTVPPEIEPLTPFTVSWTTKNFGTHATVAAFTDKVFFSADNVAGNADDIELGGVAVPATLGVNQSVTLTLNNAVMPTLPVRPSGNYFIYVRTDFQNHVHEGTTDSPNETNNTTFQTVNFQYRVADLQVQSITTPPEAETETVFALGWTSRNDGLRNAGIFNESVFFSLDNQVGDDLEIGSFQLTGGIAAGLSVNRIQNVTIPTSAIMATGNYFIYVKTDSENAVDEGANENNNVTFQPLHVRRLLRPDLTITNITAPATVFFGQEIQIQWTIKNDGQGATNSTQWSDEILLGLNQTLDGAERLALVSNISFLNDGESYIASATVRIPRGRNGSYFILVRTDLNNEVNEESEANNIQTRPITINVPPLPDLRVSNVQAPEEGFSGAPISMSWTVTNHGTGTTPPTENISSDGIYLSSDTTFDAGDRFIGSRQRTGAIAVNGNYAVSNFNVSLPGDVFGNYYVFIVADYQNQIYEFTSENNNSDYDRVQPGSPLIVRATPPDLTILNQITAPASGNGGQQIAISFTVKNQGAFDATGNWGEGVYISADQTLNPDQDALLGSVLRTNLPAGAQYVASLSVTLPNCLNGSYYLFVVTDVNGQISEFDPKGNGETNNVSQPKLIQMTTNAPDLRVTSIQTPPTANAGQGMAISWTVQNFGTVAVASQTGWYDNVVIYPGEGQSPITLATIQHSGALAASATYTQNTSVIIPRQLEGSYQLVVTTDFYNYVTECEFETNNQMTGAAFNIENDLPDLRINTFDAPNAATLGSTFDVSWTGVNAGTAMTQATGWTDRVYLSSDQTIGSGDSIVGSAILNSALGAGANYSANASITIPNIAAGNYYLLVAADNSDNVEEGNMEGNNASAAVPIALTLPQIDLQASSVNSNAILFAGQNTDVSWTVTNLGTQPTLSANWVDYVILSRDSVYDPTDRVVGYQIHAGVLNGGASYSTTISVFIPAGLTGDYTLLVIADLHNSVTENNEANNVSAGFAVNLQLPPPAELNITNITTPASIVLGNAASFTWTVQNSSSNAANGVWQDSVYLSLDANWDSSDIVVGQQTHAGPVNAFATYTETLNTVIPPVDTGTYYVIVRTDSRNHVRESNEINNVSTSVGTSTVSVQNLTLGVPISTTLATAQERFFSITNTPVDETMLVNLTGETGSENELFTRYGSMVSRANYEFFDPQPRRQDQENVVPNTKAGTYYTMIRGDYVPSSFARDFNEKPININSPEAENVQLKAEILPFGIRRVSPTTAGNQGFTTLLIEGAKFQTGATIKLVGANSLEIVPVQARVGTARIAAVFDLNGRPAGDYSIVVRNPDNQTTTLTNGFSITNGGGHRLRVGIAAPDSGRPGVYARFTVSIANDGLNDALTVPLLMIMPLGYEYRLSGNLIPIRPDLLPEGIPETDIPMHLDTEDGRVVILFVPVVRSRDSVEIGIDIKAPLDSVFIPLRASLLPPLFIPDQNITRSLLNSLNAAEPNDKIVFCIVEALKRIVLNILSLYLPSDCIGAIMSQVVSSIDYFSEMLGRAATNTGGFDAFSGVGGLLYSAVQSALTCANQFNPFKKAKIVLDVMKGLKALWDIYQSVLLGQECDPDNPPVPPSEYDDEANLRIRFSSDPNEKIGPDGFGPEKFVPINQPLTYRINFENLATATAPAQKIRIVDQLPPTLDARTLRLTEIGFKQTRVEVPENRAFYQTRLQLGEDLNNLKADISAGLDITTGRVTWTLTAIDPATNEQPLNPTFGLLPPNNANHDGDGYVIFTIQAKSNQPTRTDIANNATIYFDDNEPIITNTTTNLLDSGIPTSQMTALPASHESPTFNLSWAGSDDATGSGLRDYDVWVSEQGSPYQHFISTPETSATFNGKYGRTYRFYTTARDNAGNVELPPETFDAMTRVRGGAFEADVAPRPEGDNNGQITNDDVGQIRRFVAKLDTGYQYNEFQRADTAPLSDRGNGTLSVADVIQARRYALGLDAVAIANGPNTAASFGDGNRAAKTGGPNIANKREADESQAMPPRELKAAFLFRTGNRVVIGVNLKAQGDEVGASFTLNFNTAHLTNPTNITLGSGAGAATLTSNTAEASQGRVGIVIDNAPNQPLTSGAKQLVTIVFDVVNNAPSTTISFGNTLVENEVVNGTADALTTTFSDALLTLLEPTSVRVTISGRVLTTSGNGIFLARVSLADTIGVTRTVLTNPFGNYRFEGVEVGQSYVLSIRHKQFAFASPTQVLYVTQEVNNLDFVASP